MPMPMLLTPPMSTLRRTDSQETLLPSPTRASTDSKATESPYRSSFFSDSGDDDFSKPSLPYAYATHTPLHLESQIAPALPALPAPLPPPPACSLLSAHPCGTCECSSCSRSSAPSPLSPHPQSPCSSAWCWASSGSASLTPDSRPRPPLARARWARACSGLALGCYSSSGWCGVVPGRRAGSGKTHTQCTRGRRMQTCAMDSTLSPHPSGQACRALAPARRTRTNRSSFGGPSQSRSSPERSPWPSDSHLCPLCSTL
ncbi:hypothetical protein C8Q74DRAFT_593721 [Fomes fomentarius]|nr:hypothetical protein C8Q74DRAFT_593721 [Fomes fomentarius]